MVEILESFLSVRNPDLSQEISEKEYTNQLFQPINASDKILEKTTHLEEHCEKIGKDLEDAKSALEQIPTLENAIAKIETTLSQSLRSFNSFPEDVKDILNGLKKKVKKGLAGRNKVVKETQRAKGKGDQNFAVRNRRRRPRSLERARAFDKGEQTDMDGCLHLSRQYSVPSKELVPDDADGRTRQHMRRDWLKTMLQCPQEKVLEFIQDCWLHSCNPVQWKIKSEERSPLVVAVEKGFYDVVNKLLNLMHQVKGNHFPEKLEALKKALDKKYDQTAALIVKDMQREHPKELRKIFIAQQKMSEAEVPLHRKLYNDNYLNFWLALLDTLSTDEDLKLFEVGEQGCIRCKPGRSVLDLLTNWAHWEIFSHPVVQSFVMKKWLYCNRRCQFKLECIIYLFTLGCLTALVVISGMTEDVTSYHSFQARHLFEVLTMILLLFSLVKEILELITEGICLYVRYYFNIVEFLSSVLLLIALPLRYIPSQCHWYLFAVGYFLWVIIFFKYAILNREFGTYAQSLWIILYTDVVYFLVMFAVVDLAFSGSLYLILRGDNYLLLHTETSTWWGALFVGLRALTDGQNSLEYHGGEEGFKSFQSVATIVMFMFVVIVLLSNILIAQLSNTYKNIQEKSFGNMWAHKAHAICRLQRASWLNCLIKPKESEDSKMIEEIISSLPSETKNNVQIDKNMANLCKKLPAIESNIAGVKAQTELFRRDLAKAEGRFKQALADNRIEDLASTLEELEATIKAKCKSIEKKIDKYTSFAQTTSQETN